MDPNAYSRLVAWLKILLPLGALAILSSVVFLARMADDVRTIPFETDGGDPRQQRISAPEFRSVATDGSAITISAHEVRPVDGSFEVLDADGLSATIERQAGRTITAVAPSGRVDGAGELATFTGNVTVQTSDGFDLVAKGLSTSLRTGRAESSGQVDGRAPFGTLTAGRMRIEPGKGDLGGKVLFVDGVRLIYQPRQEDELK